LLRQKLYLVATILIALASCGPPRPQSAADLLKEADRLALLYNWPKAAPLYAQAHSLFEKSGDTKDVLFARLGYIWGTASIGVRPEISQEVSRYLQDPLVKEDLTLMLRALVTKAALDRNESESAARDPWERVLKLSRTLDDKRWEARAQAELAGITYLDGDVKSATAMLREALTSQYLRDRAAAINYTGMVCGGFVEAGQPEAGLRYCNAALRLAWVVGDNGFPYLAYQGKARALFALRRNEEAEAVLQEALAQARNEQNHLVLADLLVVAGNAAAPDNPDKAIQYLKEATDLSETRGFRHVFAWSTFELAKVYRDAGDLDNAEVLASNAIATMRDIEDRYHLPEHLGLLADIEAKRGDLERADELYSEATDVIDGLLVNVTTKHIASSLIATLSQAYLGHFELTAIRFSDPTKAYEIIERARGRSLADALRERSEALSPEDDITVEAQRNINRIQLALLHETNRDRRQVLLDELFEAEARHWPGRRADSLFGSPMDRPKAIPLPSLQASLQPDEMLLEYVLDEPQSYCLRITSTSVAVVALPAGRKQIDDLVENYLTAVRSRKPEITAGQQLFSMLLQPVIDQESQARLIVVPDGKLHLLPFDALKDLQGRYVLETHIVSYAPSGTVLNLLRSSRSSPQATMNFLGVGGVNYPSSAVVTARTNDSTASSPNLFDLNAVTIPNLPGIRQEVISLAGLMEGPSRVLLDGNATEEAFKALPLADFRVIHLAAHGVASTSFPDRAALLLGSSPALGEDGLLQAREIRDLPLNADLVTLSACETGNGKLLGQDGIASLERAFLLAGAKAVIASLWTADDTYTVVLMKRLYEHLADGVDKGMALRQAKLDLVNQFGAQALPVYWAGFTLVGDGSTAIFK